MAKQDQKQHTPQAPEPVRDGLTDAQIATDAAARAAFQPVDAPAAAPPDGAEAADYYEFTWAGHVAFQCTHCPCSTLVEAEMADHVYDRHSQPGTVQAAAAPLFDQWGNPIPPPEPPQAKKRRG